MTLDPESIVPALQREARDSERHELPAWRDTPTAADLAADRQPLQPTPEQRKLIRDAFAEAMATALRRKEARDV